MASIAKGSWGKLISDDQIKDCPNARVARDFLVNVIGYVTKRSFQFYEAYERVDYPLRYDERRMMSLFIAAIDRITPCHLAEHPVQRLLGSSEQEEGIGTNISHGSTRVDMWCYYRKRHILVELKRSYGSPVSLEHNRRISGAWSALECQLHSIKEELNSWQENHLRVGILTVFVFQSNMKRKLSTKTSKEIFEDGKRLINKNGDCAWCSAWIPPGESMVVEYEGKDGNIHKDICRTVLFFANLPIHNGGYS